MTPEAVRWYKAAGAQDYGSASCIIDCWEYDMPRDLNGMQYHMGWDYCAAQLEQLGCIGDAVEIYRLHRGRKARVFLQGALLLMVSLVSFHPIFLCRSGKFR